MSFREAAATSTKTVQLARFLSCEVTVVLKYELLLVTERVKGSQSQLAKEKADATQILVKGGATLGDMRTLERMEKYTWQW